VDGYTAGNGKQIVLIHFLHGIFKLLCHKINLLSPAGFRPDPLFSVRTPAMHFDHVGPEIVTLSLYTHDIPDFNGIDKRICPHLSEASVSGICQPSALRSL
jgi:hypothetical protein